MIVGLGSIAIRHLKIARTSLPDADTRVHRHQPCASAPDFSNGCVNNFDEARAFAPQVAVIANPAPYHLDTATCLAKSGIHLLVEKPLSDGIQGVKRLLQLCQDSKITLLVGYNLRFLPSLQQFKKYCHSGIIGRICSVQCVVGQYLPSWRQNIDYRLTVSSRKKLGGGVLLELSHEIDYLRWIFGEIESVLAASDKLSDLEIDVEDTAHLLFYFKKDKNGKQIRASLNMDFIRHDAVRQCVAIGTKGTLRWNGLTGTVDAFKQNMGSWQKLFCHNSDRNDSYIAEWKHFLRCIIGEESPSVSGKDGLRVLEIIEASRRASIQKQEPVVSVDKGITFQD